MDQKYRVYRRMVDGGHGLHVVVVSVETGVCIEQTLHAAHGGHIYTGDGNPEFIGQTIRQINSGFYENARFKRARMTANQYSDWLENRAYS